MHTPQSSTHTFVECLADHSPFQSWRAINLASGDQCFVKYIAAGTTATEQAVAMQIAACKLQRRIRSAGVLKARTYRIENGSLLVEYPWLDSQLWSRLDFELFWQQPEIMLIAMCVQLDYLHLLGLVHGDIKLDNFMVRRSPSLQVKLIDLDFLSRDNSRPQARLFGTPDHIAPEIQANDIIAAQSDNYSFGVSLGRALAWRQEHNAASPDLKREEKLCGLVEALTHTEHLQRPYGLLEASRQYGVIDDETYLVAVRRLLGSYFLSRVHWPHFFSSPAAAASGYELRGKLGIFGVHPEITAAVWQAAQRAPRCTFAWIKEIIAHSRIERFERFFSIAIDDQHATDLLRKCRVLTKDSSVDLSPDGSLAEALARGRQEAAEGRPLAAYLFLKQHLAALEKEHQSLALVDYLCELGKLATQQIRLSEAHGYFERALQIQRDAGSVSFEVVYEAASTAVRIPLLDTASAHLQAADILSDLTLEQRLRLERVRGWIFHLRGNYSDAEQVITRLVQQADDAQLHSLSIAGRYTLGVVSWRRSDNRRALDYLNSAYKLARVHHLLTDAVPVLAMLAMLHTEAGRYHRAVRLAKLAVQAAQSEQTPMLQFLYEILLTSCIRMALFAKARYWLQEYIGNRASDGGRQLITMYSLYAGFIESQAGRLREGAAILGPVSAGGTTMPDRLSHAKVCQNLATIELWRGRVERCREYSARARRDYEAFHSSSSLAELDLLDELITYTDPSAGNRDKLLSLATALQQHNACYYANLALFFAFVCQPDGNASGPLQVQRAMTYKDSQAVPLFAALRTLAAYYAQANSEPRQEILSWKLAFTTLLQGKQIHLALQAAIKISQLYARTNHPRHARSFLLHAKSLAQSLENEAVQFFLDSQLAITAAAPSEHSRLVESYLSISELLRDIGEYHQAIRRVLEFAIEQTGAERGILFLKKGDRDEFQVGASVNCDERSLEELRDFSSHLPWLSSQEQSPLLIDNAVQDQRTSKYHSVIEHNILSVACVPLREGQILRGVLYLDHHTIPALFEPEDIRYLMSLANFLTLILATASGWRSITLTNAELRDELSRLGNPKAMVTQDPALLRMMEKLPQIARTSANILILGESGTGKEILADMIHRLSLRAAEPLIKLNCATLSPTLLESELFGIARSVATGVAERDGKFAAADGGTLFLDEIGDMALDIQAKVLRAIEYQQFEKVGSNRTIRTDIRFIYATHRDLAQAVADKTFRQDLYYRINTIALHIPPLRQRQQDIPILLNHFLTLLSRGSGTPRFSPAAIEVLVRYHWPGNIRQLRNVVDHCIILYPGAVIEPSMLPREIVAESEQGEDAAQAVATAEKNRIRAALIQTHGNESQSAKLLDMALSTLRRRIKKYGLEDFT